MGEVLGIGLSHFPGPLVPAKYWPQLLRTNVEKGRIPSEVFADVEHWPAPMRAEQGATLTEMVVENLMLERRQVAIYTALIREIGDNDPTTRNILVGILSVTEKHASELADYLKHTSEMRK